MAEIVNITPINPFTFELQEYSNSDSSLITSFNIDTTFNSQTDYLEYFIYDLNGNILVQNVSGYPGYKLINNNVVLNPETDLKAFGYTEGQYNTLYNFLSPKLSSNNFNPYFISEISSDRTEDLIQFWEDKLGVSFADDQEVWDGFFENEETLNLNNIKELCLTKN